MTSVADSSQNGKQPVSTETVEQWYELNADFLIEEYERVDFQQLHAAFLQYLPNHPCLILDIGSGTGRDAAGLADLGHSVVAVEPCYELRKRARARHRQKNIRWVDDKLPALSTLPQSGDQFDLISLSAVWMHLPPAHRGAALRRIVSLLKPGGFINLTLRHGQFEQIKGYWDIPDQEVIGLAKELGLIVLKALNEDDSFGRKGISWTRIVLRSAP